MIQFDHRPRSEQLGPRSGNAAVSGTSIRRLESIQMMRGIAAFSVMIYHLTYANDNFRAKLPGLSALFSYGYLGIWMFFVISGFVIPLTMSGVYYRFPLNAWPFLLRRIARLEPPYVISVFVAFAIAYAAEHTPGYRGAAFSPDIQTFLAQFVYLAPWVHRPWINGVAWTLAIEFQYYILMLFIGPLLVSESKGKWALCFVVIIVSSVLINDKRAVFMYLPCFGLGFASLLYYEQRLKVQWLAILIVALGLLNSYKLGMAPAIAAVASAVLILMPIHKPLPLLSFLGTISYSLYLVHQPIGNRVINLTTRLPAIGWLQSLGLVVAVAASVGAASALWWFVERPSTSLSKTISETVPAT